MLAPLRLGEAARPSMLASHGDGGAPSLCVGGLTRGELSLQFVNFPEHTLREVARIFFQESAELLDSVQPILLVGGGDAAVYLQHPPSRRRSLVVGQGRERVESPGHDNRGAGVGAVPHHLDVRRLAAVQPLSAMRCRARLVSSVRPALPRRLGKDSLLRWWCGAVPQAVEFCLVVHCSSRAHGGLTLVLQDKGVWPSAVQKFWWGWKVNDG